MTPEKQKVRLRFRKEGPARWISHLDLNRLMARSLRRAKIPAVMTEGFNPHPKLVFTNPIPVASESDCELLDFSLPAGRDLGADLEALCRAVPEGIVPVELYERSGKLDDVCFAVWRFSMGEAGGAQDICAALLAKEALPVMKKTKSGIKETDIKPNIKKMYTENGDLYAVCDFSRSMSLNPFVLRSAFENAGMRKNVKVRKTAVLSENFELFI